MEILLLEVTPDIFLSAIVAFTYCLFYLTFLLHLTLWTLHNQHRLPPLRNTHYLISLTFFVFPVNSATNLVYLWPLPDQRITQASRWLSRSESLPPLIQNASVTHLLLVHTSTWPSNPFLSTRPSLPLLFHILCFPPGSRHSRNDHLFCLYHTKLDPSMGLCTSLLFARMALHQSIVWLAIPLIQVIVSLLLRKI